MNSKYAYAHFIEGINSTDQTKDGELVQFNYPIYAGETRLMSVGEYEMLQRDFPNRIKGGVIKQNNLIYVINELYSQLKKEIDTLTELDDYTRSRFEYLKNEYERDGVLKPDSETETSINDLANKFFVLQEQVRKNRRQDMDRSNHHR